MSSYAPPPPPFDPSMVTTALELPGYRIVRNLGIVRGIVVRSRSIFGTFGAGLQTIVGGNITILSQLCQRVDERSHRGARLRDRRRRRARLRRKFTANPATISP